MVKRNTNSYEIYYPKNLTKDSAEKIFDLLKPEINQINTPLQTIWKLDNIITSDPSFKRLEEFSNKVNTIIVK